MSQFGKPTGLFGKLLAKGMAWGHRDFYKNAAKALDFFLEPGQMQKDMLADDMAGNPPRR